MILAITNEKGLHARASAKFVDLVESFNAQANVSRDGMQVSGDSIMGLLMLAASKGTTISVTTDGSQADELAIALKNLVESKFGESN